jgi:glutathione S-transferase
MKLCIGATSPFSRKVRAAAIECCLTDRITLVPTRTMGHDPYLLSINPLVKVPALLTDDGQAIYDSPVICEFFDTLHDGPRLIPTDEPERWPVLRRQALGDGMMEALIFLHVPARRPRGHDTPEPIMARQRDKVIRGLDALEGDAGAIIADGVTVGTLSVGCALGWLDFAFPDWDWRAGHLRLAAWYTDFAARPSMAETAPVRRA